MLYYFRKYPVSLIIVAIIFYLSFFTPPKTDVEEIPYIDKVVHIMHVWRTLFHFMDRIPEES